VPLDRVRLTAAKSGLGRHRKLRLTRPKARTRARPRKTTNSASPDPGLELGLGPGRRRTPPRPTQGSDSGSAPEDNELRLARPRARTRARPRKTTNSASPDPRARTRPRPQPTVSVSPDPRARTRPRPRRSLCLAQPRARTDHATGGVIITLPLASSGYGEQDRRPIWLAPVKQIMMAPRMLHNDGGSQPPYGSKETSARTRRPRQLSFRQAPALLQRPRHHTNRVPKPLWLPRWHVLRALAPLC
jgi:hypothetical protein